MKVFIKYTAVIILAAVLLSVCGLLMLLATAVECSVLTALCVAGAIIGAIGLSYLIAEVD